MDGQDWFKVVCLALVLLPGIKPVHHIAQSLQMPKHLCEKKELSDQWSVALLFLNVLDYT